MIGTIVLFEIALAATATATATAAPGTSLRAISAEPVDLSTYAARVHINREALEGWVPLKGTPAPLPEPPKIVILPGPPQTPETASREHAEENASAESWESVNAFDGPRPYFYGSGGVRRPHLGPAHAHRQAPVTRAPGRGIRGMGRTRPR